MARRTPEELDAEEARVLAAYRKLAARDFMVFVRGLKIAGQRGPAVFESVATPMQLEVFQDIASSLHALRDGQMPEWPRWWIERTKKASKDADLAVIILWLIAFAERPFYAQVGAGDRDQAGIVKERISVLLHLNPWLTEYVEMVQWHIKSKQLMVSGAPMAHLDIMASDIGGAHGGTPDLLVVNELTHITKWEFVQNLMDNADGVAQGMVIVATNAGYKGTQAEVWRKNALAGKRWRVHIWDKPAPWHNQAAIEDAKTREISKSRFNRLWWGKWASGKGDALSEDAIDAVFNQKGWKELVYPIKGYHYVAGLDIGVHHDHCGFVVLGVHPRRGVIDVACLRAWEPGPKGAVQLPLVEAAVTALCTLFHVKGMFYDPHQAILMAQRMQSVIPCYPLPFTTTNLNKMCNCFIQVVEGRQLRSFDIEDGRLRRDFGKFNIVEKSYGYRLEALRDASGHADVGTALLIALPAAVDLMNGLSFSPDDELMEAYQEDLTEKEIAELPDELRDIYEMGEADELEALYKRRPDYVGA
jgi:hypothetical protein